MSRESEIKAILLADPTILGLTGQRIFTRDEVGESGLTYENTTIPIYADGELLTSLLISEREEINDLQVEVRDPEAFQSSLQVVEIWGYEERDYNDLDIIFLRIRKILPAVKLEDSFELEWVLTTGRLRDNGAIAGASLIRQDWSVASVR